LNALELGLGAGLGGMARRRVAREVVGHASIRRLVCGVVANLRVVDADDIGETLVTGSAAEMLAALLLGVGRARIRVSARTTSACSDRENNGTHGSDELFTNPPGDRSQVLARAPHARTTTQTRGQPRGLH
jgi:hypothetical protein